MTDGFSGRRPVRRSYEDVEADAFVRELEEGGAYVSPGGAAPWRGLDGYDPLDDEDPFERGERLFDEWHALSENEEERPARRSPGRAMDIEPPCAAPVVTRVDPEIARRFAAKQAEAEPRVTWEVDGGTVTVVGALKLWRGPCAQCSAEFEQSRPGDQKRRWKKTCSDVCAAAWRRDRARERKQRQRGRKAA
ncbi:hypothetical protein [Streptomyces sp. NPDC003877]